MVRGSLKVIVFEVALVTEGHVDEVFLEDIIDYSELLETPGSDNGGKMLCDYSVREILHKDYEFETRPSKDDSEWRNRFYQKSREIFVNDFQDIWNEHQRTKEGS